MKTFLIHHTHILYKYMQQLLEPSIADYLKKQKEEKMDKLAEVAVTEDDCKVCTVLKQNVDGTNYDEVIVTISSVPYKGYVNSQWITMGINN